MGYGLKLATETSNNLDINSIRNIIKSSKENEGDFAFLVGVCLGGTCNDDQPCAWPERLMLAIESIKRNKDIKVSKSDKTNQLVIMDIDTYRNKMNDLLLDETIYDKLTKNPIKSGSAEFNRKLKDILMGISDSESRIAYINSFKTINPDIAYIYGLPKTTKPNVPLRPIISSSTSYTQKLSKFLASFLAPIVGKIPIVM